MEEVIPSFDYEILVFSSKPETSNEKETRGNIDGVGPSCIKKSRRGTKRSQKREGYPSKGGY
jgi:hypothetical protein